MEPKKMTFTQEELKESLHYNPETGEFTWLKTGFNKQFRIGKRAGFETIGYRKISYRGKLWQEHRLAWFYMTGIEPRIIDHINRKPNDNRWCNLRETTPELNLINMTTKHDGIYELEKKTKANVWRLVFCYKKKTKHIGNFATKEEAMLVRNELREKYYGKEWACLK